MFNYAWWFGWAGGAEGSHRRGGQRGGVAGAGAPDTRPGGGQNVSNDGIQGPIFRESYFIIKFRR